MKRWQSGFWSGILATGPMTLFLFEAHKSLPQKEKKALPPAMLTRAIAKKLNLDSVLTEEQKENLIFLSHLGFGGVCGSLYSLFTQKSKMHPVLTGSLFGLGVWSTSYLGWIPAMDLRPKAVRTSPERNTMMILAHLVWGASLGLMEKNMQLRDYEMLKDKKSI